MRDSEFNFDCVHLLYYKCHEIYLNRGGSYIDYPGWIKNKIASINPIKCIFLLRHIQVLESICTLQLPECQGTPCLKQGYYLKFKWLQQDVNPQPLSL